MSEQPLKTFLTTREVTAMLRIGRTTMFRYVREMPDFPKAYRIGVSFIFDKAEVLAWIDSQRMA